MTLLGAPSLGPSVDPATPATASDPHAIAAGPALDTDSNDAGLDPLRRSAVVPAVPRIPCVRGDIEAPAGDISAATGGSIADASAAAPVAVLLASAYAVTVAMRPRRGREVAFES